MEKTLRSLNENKISPSQEKPVTWPKQIENLIENNCKLNAAY